jgi:ABC-type transport system involved in multi-copper enzyme maturation permease subunit
MGIVWFKSSHILAVAHTEWRLQVRSRVFWLAGLGAITLSLASALTGRWIRSATPLARSLDLGSDFSAGAIILALMFICMPVFHRDRPSGMADLLWATPLQVSQYVTGKLLAVLALGVGLFLSVETVTWVAVHVGWQIPACSPLLLHLVTRLALLLPTLAFVLTVNLLLAALIRRPRLLLLSGLVIWLGAGFLRPSTMLRPGNFVPVELFYSSILGLGPDGTLLIANRVLWTGVALIMLVAATALYARCERRAYLCSRSMWVLGLAGMLGLGLTLGGWRALERAAEPLRTDPPPVRLILADPSPDDTARHSVEEKLASAANSLRPDWLTVNVLTVAVDLSLAPDNGQMHGQATLTLRYDGDEALAEVPLFLNSGLRIESVTDIEDETEAPFTRAGLELTLHPRPPLEPGAIWKVQIVYGGHYKTPRVAYRDLDACLHSVAEPHAYLGQGVAFLLRDGDWYPWPQSLSARREATGRLTVRLPAGRQTFHTGQMVADDRLVWDGRWPAPLVASYPPGKLRPLAVASGQAYLADPGDVVAKEEASAYAAAYAGLSHWLEEKTTPITLIQVPLILQPVAGADPSGEEVLFIPEGTAFVNRQRDGWTGVRARGDADGLRRARAREAATAWWSARLDFPPPRYVAACPFMGIDCTTNPGCTLQVASSDVFLDLLASVSAGAWLGTTGQPVDRADESLLFETALVNAGVTEVITVTTQAEMEHYMERRAKAHGARLEAQKALIQRGALPVSVVPDPYQMHSAAPDLLVLVEAWVRLGDEGLGDVLRDWLAAHCGGQADANDLLQRLRQWTDGQRSP